MSRLTERGKKERGREGGEGRLNGWGLFCVRRSLAESSAVLEDFTGAREKGAKVF